MKNKKLYLECYSGISGDMFTAALIGLGADQDKLQQALASIPLTGYTVMISTVNKSGIEAYDFNVALDKGMENHDHDMEFLHGKKHGGTNIMPHGHTHRGLDEISQIIGLAKITEHAKTIALKIVQVLAEAEGEAHGCKTNEVHFHEVGAIDSIVDIVAAAVCLDDLAVTDVVIPCLYEGKGTVRCNHGVMPIPVPAVMNIIRNYGLPVHIMDMEGEFITPTGAAIAAALSTSCRLPSKFRILRTGIGAGKREYEKPSILRAMMIEADACTFDQDASDTGFLGPDADQDAIYKLESNMDDCSGEILGYLMERLFESGARDVHYTPVFMKKNRPGWQLNVICRQTDIAELERIIFSETTTIGIRRQKFERTVLPRRQEKVLTPFGEAEVKVCFLDSEVRYYPEYESIKKLARKGKVPFSVVYNAAWEICKNGFQM